MKLRFTALILSILMLIPCALSACDGGEPAETTAPAVEGTEGAATPTETTAEATEAATTVEETTAEEIKNTEPPKSLKILAIGNSFSTDSMQYLYEIMKDGGVEEITLGNLYYGGCSLDQHYQFGRTDSASYTYYKNTGRGWIKTEGYKMSQALNNEKWDYVSLQQTSKTCGLTNSYGRLDEMIDIVKKACPDAKLIWNMTWAYQQDSTHSSFPNYGKDQMKMYNMIIDVVNTVITPLNFDIVIPCMTSIQNARTSFMGDTLTRDGYHLDYYIGRYIAGLTWYAAITGGSVDGITYNPSTAKITDDMLRAAKEAVTTAIKTPLAVTQSTVTTGARPEGDAPIEDPSIQLSPADFIEADTKLAAQNSIDLSKYTLLEWNYLENTYWNSTSKATTTVPKSSASTYQQNVCCDRKYSISELPLGTIFIVDSGWQYRLEGFVTDNAKYTGKRPGMITQNFFVLDANFLGDMNYLVWNVASNPKTDISKLYAQAACHLRIYVPKAQ
ncbi:MAG: DUF4886 domain-containing protein [Clostridia bacterium]|nr:DUF4886 domain-containing protein [Clostridia bacterium]